jgi:hypothetical protein
MSSEEEVVDARHVRALHAYLPGMLVQTPPDTTPAPEDVGGIEGLSWKDSLQSAERDAPPG